MSERKLQLEIDMLKEQINKICSEFYDFFEDKPDDDGRYFHLGICSASHLKPVGASGCVCRNAPIFQRLKNPHNWMLLEKTRIPERGLRWDKFECSKCKWTATLFVDTDEESKDIEELNKAGWCPVFE